MSRRAITIIGRHAAHTRARLPVWSPQGITARFPVSREEEERNTVASKKTPKKAAKAASRKTPAKAPVKKAAKKAVAGKGAAKKARSEERRVGKEGRDGGGTEQD